jgi:DNA polymerase delta subunit 2
VSDEDKLFVEDETGRVALVGDGSVLQVEKLVNGIVVAIRGRMQAGDFEVKEYCFCGYPPQLPLKPPPSSKPPYIALLSGLRIGDPAVNPLHVQLAVDYLTGILGTDQVRL